MIEAVGYIGAVLFAFCALPQTIKCIREKSSHGLSWGFLGMWFWGELLTSFYVFADQGWNGPLHGNYIVNFILLLPMVYYKFKDTLTTK